MAALVRQFTRRLSSAAARQTQSSSSGVSAVREGVPATAAALQLGHHQLSLRRPRRNHRDERFNFSDASHLRQLRRHRHFTANPSGANPAAPPGIASDDVEILQSIVKVFTVSSSPNFFMPWQNKTQSEKTGSGVVATLHLPDVPNGIGVLTNAHVVSDQTFVQVRRHGSSVKYQARVYAVGHDCDLAVLTVDDPSFFDDSSTPAAQPSLSSSVNADDDDGSPTTGGGAADDAESSATAATATATATAGMSSTNAENYNAMEGGGSTRSPPGVRRRQVRPPPLGEVPNLQEQVSVMGFPSGGDNLSITSGVVSRVELTNYAHGAAQLLAIQLDAAINPGNSGGPALQAGKVVGLAFQNLPGMDNIGYVIPTPIIRRFLEDIATEARRLKRAASKVDSKESRSNIRKMIEGRGSVGNSSSGDEGVALKGNENGDGVVVRVSGGVSTAAENINFEKDSNVVVGDGSGGGSGGCSGSPSSRTLDHAGFCALGVKCQAMDNPALRSYFGMLPGETGVLVTNVLKVSPSAGALDIDDVLLEVDGEPVANDGTVVFRGWERVAFDHLISLKEPGQEVKLKVRRRRRRGRKQSSEVTVEEDGNAEAAAAEAAEAEAEAVRSEVITVTIAVQPRSSLVPVHQYDRLPSYYVFAGLLFSPLTQPLLHEWGDDWYNQAPRRLCDRALNDDQEEEGEEVVVLSQVLADEINAGHQGMQDVEVRQVDGKDIRSMRQLKRAVEGAKGEFLRLDLQDTKVLVVNLKEAREAHAMIMAKHRVPYNCSRDLM